MKIKKTASAKHEAHIPPYIRTFVSTAVDLSPEKLAEHLATFPKLWPFPRGDLYQWIPVLNKFDDILEETIKKYKLKDGPQTIPWEEIDEKIICAILNFSRMLVEECGNRSLYASSAHINDLLNTTSLDVLEACLRLGARLAQRYYTSKSRGQSVNASNQALLLSHYNIKLEKVINLCLPFVKYSANITANSPKGTFKAAVPAYANDLGAIAREKTGKAEEKSAVKHTDEWDQWGRVLVTYYSTAPKSPASAATAQLPTLTEPTSPTLSRRATHPPPNLATPSRRPTEAEPAAQPAVNDGMQALEIASSKVKSSSMEELLKIHLPTLPSEAHYEFLQSLRVSWALTHGLKRRRQILGIRILAITNAAYVLSESAFNSKILTPDQNEPRRLQLAYQLADLVSGTSNASSSNRSEVPRQLQAYAFGALEALARQKTKTTDVCAALSMNVNHGVLMYVVRKMLAELSADKSMEEEVDGGEEWRNALFGLLQFLPNAAHTGQLVVAAGLVPVLVEILNLRTALAIRAMPKVITLTDALLYSVGTAFQAFTNAKGLDAVVDLVFDEVEASFKEVETADANFEQYRSPSVDFKISHIRQHTLKSLWKFLHHMMMQNSGGNDRLLRNLIDNSKSIEGMKMVMANGQVFGNGVWSATVNVFSTFVHNEPTSYAAIHEAGLSQVLLEAVGGRIPPKEQKTEAKEGETTTAEGGDAMEVEPAPAAAAPAPAVQVEVTKPTEDLTKYILPAADAMQQVLNGIGAICLNTTGLALIQSSGALEKFFEIFRSPAHVKVLVDGEVARNIGNQIDELSRHHPVLKDLIIKAVMGVCRHTLEIGEKFAIEKGAGAKAWVDDGKGGMIVSGGRRAVIGANRSSVQSSTVLPVPAPASTLAPDAAPAVSSDGDVQMTEDQASTSEVQHETIAIRETDGSLPNEIVPLESVVDDDEILEPHDASKEPGISSYVEVTANFLDGFIQNKAHAKDFIEHEGLDLILKIYSLPSLPYNFAVRQGSSALSRVMHFCSEQSPQKTTAVILKHAEEAVQQLKPLLEFNGAASYFAPLIESSAAVAPRLQSGPPSDMTIDTDNKEVISEALKVDGTSTIKALVTVHGIVSLLGELYNQAAFSARAINPLSNAITASPLCETLIPLLGQLQRTCVWEEIVLQKTIPETWNKATKTPDSLPMMVEETIAEANDEATKPPTEPEAAKATEAEKTPELEGKTNTFQFKNVKTIRFLMSEIPTALTPFLQGLSRSLLMRRNLDLAQKQTAFKAAELITDVAHKHLTWERTETATASVDKQAYWIVMLTSIGSLLVDDSHGTQAIVLTLKTFLQNGGIETIVSILETLWAELETLPPPSQTELSKEERSSMAHIFGTIKVILVLFQAIVSSKAVSESPQALILSQNRERDRPDYFVPEHFLVEIRYAVLPVVHKIWESPLFEKASSSNVKAVIDVLSSILRGEGETQALRRKDKPKPSRLSWRSMEPDQDKIRALTDMGFTEQQATEALLRCNFNVDSATDRLISLAANARASGSGASSRPQTADSDSSSGEQTDTEADVPVGEAPAVVVPVVAEAPAPVASGSEAAPAIPAPAVAMEVEVTVEEPGSTEARERLVVMSIDNLLSENPSAPPPAPATAADSTVNAPVVDTKGKGKADTLEQPTPPTEKAVAWEDLEEAREELRESLVSRCLEVLQVHDNITFELSSLIQSANPKGADGEETRREVVIIIVQSLVSLYDDDFRSKGKIIASTAHILGLLLQDQSFYKASVEDLKQQIPDLVGFLKMYDGEPAPWIPNILLVLEKMVAEDTEPKEVELNIPEITNKLPFVAPPDFTIDFNDKLAIFDAVTKLLPQVGKDDSLALSIARVLSTLTRSRKLAERMIAEGHVKHLFAMVKAQNGTSVTRLQTCVIYILRHVIEDKETIKAFMRAEIKTSLSQSKIRHLDAHNFVKNHAHLVLRDPESFVEVVDELCKHKSFDPSYSQLRYQQIGLKETEVEKPKEPEEPVASSSADTKAEDTKEGEAKKDDTKKEGDKEASKETKEPKPELKTPTIDKPDGVIHFLVSELLALKESEEPPLPKPTEGEKEGEAAKAAAAASGSSHFLFPQPKSEKPELKTANNPVFVYRIFLLQCLTEILASYNKSKIEFINFSRKAKPTEPFTPSKPRSSVLNYLIYDLVPVGTVQHSDDPATKKKATVSIWAIAVIVALTTQTSESPTEGEKSDLLFIRKFVLEALLKAFKDATAMTEALDHRYSRLLGLSDIFSRMLTTGRQSSANSFQNESNKQLAKIMLEKNFIGALNLALAEMDLNFPHVRRAIKYILKPLLELSRTALSLGEISSLEPTTLGGAEEDEISTASSVSDDDDREETPDLYRHSALGMFEGDIQEDEESYDEDEDEDMIYEEDYYDDEEDEEDGSGSEMSDEANEIDPEAEAVAMHQEEAAGSEEDEEELSDDMDEDGDEIEIIDEMEEDEDMDDIEGGDDDDEDIDDEDVGDEEVDYDEDQGDWQEEGGAGQAADIVVNMDDPLESIARAIGADAMDDEFMEEGDEDEDEEDDDIDDDDEDDGRGDDLEVPVPWEWDQDMGAPPAFIARSHHAGRMGAGWATLVGGANRAEPILGIRPIRVGHSGPIRADDQQLNPLLQPSGLDHAQFPTAIMRGSDGMTDWVHAFDVHNGGGTIQMMNTLLSVLSRSGQVPPLGITAGFPFAGTVTHHHFPRGELSHRDLRTLFGSNRHRYDFEARTVRDDVFTVVNSFTLATTRERWLEEARLLFGNQQPQDKVLKVLNAMFMKLVPPAIEEDKIRKQREKEEAEREAERKRIEEEELAAKRKQEEEERLKREEEERIAREKEEAERAAREAEAAAAAAAEQAAAPEPAPAATEQPAEAMEGVESTQAPEAAPAEAAPAPPPRMVVIRGQAVDVSSMGIDPDFLEALPEDMRDEVFTDHLRQRQITASANNQPSDISPEFLAALPDEIREEILVQEAQDRRRRERDQARQQAAANGQPTGPQEMDLATFLATLDPQLRQQVLLDQDDDALAQLPDTIAAEAAALRRTDRRMNHFADMHRHGHVHPRAGEEAVPKPVKKTIRKTHAQILDRAGVATLMRLMFLHLGHKVGEPLHSILLNVCENRQNRVEVINLLLSIIQDGSTDMAAVERCFFQLSLRARQTTSILKTPIQKRPAVLPQASNDISPLMVIHQCLATLSQLVSNNELIRSYFLNEHEVPTLVKRSLSRKGKGKEKEIVPHKSTKYALNILLALLDRKLVTESTSVMDLLSALLSNITRPLTVLKKDRKKAEEAEKEKEKEAEAAAQEGQQTTEGAATTTEEQPAPTETPAAPVESQPATAEVPAPSETTPAATAEASTAAGPSTSKTEDEASKDEDKEERKEKSLIPPVVPDANLRLVVNILSAPECSSKTFKETLTTMQNLSAIPGAREIFGEELIRQSQALGSVILQHLSELVPQIANASSGTEVQGIALAKFSPASSDQAKLLRLLTALDYLFDPKREKKDDEVAELDETSLPKLYERLTFAPLWKKLSGALTAIHERPEMLHIATILLPLIEALMVVCRGSGLKSDKTTRSQREKTPAVTSPDATQTEHSAMENLFFTFTEDHRKILNQMVRNNPKLMIGSFALLVNNPKVLDFDNKRNYFNRRLHTRTGSARESVPSLQLNVRRKDVFRDTYKSMYFKSGDEVKYAKLNIRFAGEEGVDAGGVTREWFQVLARAMFNPDYALFLPVASDRTTFHPNPMSSVNPEHLSFFKFIGRIIGKALYEGRVLDCHFSRAVYKRILGKNVSLKDMETLDLDYYKSLCWMLENDIEDILTETFSVITHMFGTEEIVDLIPNGRNIPVTDENKQEYVRLVVEHRLLTSVKEQMEEFLKGFHDIVPAELISIFNEQELELLISGLPEIDVDDWRNNTEYHNYSASSPQIQWFWRAVRGFDKEERAKLLQFVTGTSKVPLNGFKELEGMNGVSKFNIHRDYGSKERLPSSHTCFNQLDLPEYDSYEQLRTNLYTAITQGADYFGFA